MEGNAWRHVKARALLRRYSLRNEGGKSSLSPSFHPRAKHSEVASSEALPGLKAAPHPHAVWLGWQVATFGLIVSACSSTCVLSFVLLRTSSCPSPSLLGHTHLHLYSFLYLCYFNQAYFIHIFQIIIIYYIWSYQISLLGVNEILSRNAY